MPQPNREELVQWVKKDIRTAFDWGLIPNIDISKIDEIAEDIIKTRHPEMKKFVARRRYS